LSTNLQLRMIIYSALIVLLCLALSYIYQNRADASSLIKPQADSIRIVRVQLQGWKEDKLPYTRQTLQKIPGVVEVKFESGSHTAVIRMDVERTNLRTIEKSLHGAGFTPSYQ
jgi:heavy-metal-associated domain-containing protein